jgi:hypothetical protein
MNNYPGQQRSSIRQECKNLRGRILSSRLADLVDFLLEVGEIECSALIAGQDEVPVIRENLRQLAKRLTTANS